MSITDEELADWAAEPKDFTLMWVKRASRLIAEVCALREAISLMQKEVSKRGHMIEQQRQEIERLKSMPDPVVTDFRSMS